MKSVIVVRHAKSSWDSPGMADFDRPLNDRGKRDGPEMARRLLDKDISIQVFISSPAKRAYKTASFFAEVYGQSKEQIILVPELYEAGPDVFYSVIAHAPAQADTIAIFSHNPGITAFVNMLTEVKISDMPTCAVFAVKSAVQNWADFKNAQHEFWFFDYPKSLSV